MRRVRQVLVSIALAATLSVSVLSGGVSAHARVAQSCGYAIIASVPVNESGTKVAQLRLWNYTCTNQIHAELLDATPWWSSECLNVTNLGAYGQAASFQGSGYLCSSGSYVNSGTVGYAKGWSYAAVVVNGQSVLTPEV